jgi:uncharacterized protein YjbI with pentapeptide repeats
MADENQLQRLRRGVDVWNRWIDGQGNTRPDLSSANLSEEYLVGAFLMRTDLSEANLSKANLSKTHLNDANLSRADLSGADLYKADLRGAILRKANLSETHLIEVNFSRADLSGANLSGADLSGADLSGADLRRSDLSWVDFFGLNLSGAVLREVSLAQKRLTWADLSGSDLSNADLSGSDLRRADLTKANLSEANLSGADLSGANLSGADLSKSDLSGASLERASLVETILTDANLTSCRIYGISAWDLKLQGAKQDSLVITPEGQAEIAIDNIEVAQFVYLLLHNEKIRGVIDTIGRKGVLLLGRFTEGRLAILEKLREELRKRGFVPIVFNFDKPDTKDFTETVRLLAGLSRFVIADITNPRSTPLEIQAVVPEYMVPFVPIIEQGEKPFAMFRDLWIKHRSWVLEPISYVSIDELAQGLDGGIIKPALARFDELLKRKADQLPVRRMSDLIAGK